MCSDDLSGFDVWLFCHKQHGHYGSTHNSKKASTLLKQTNVFRIVAAVTAAAAAAAAAVVDTAGVAAAAAAVSADEEFQELLEHAASAKGLLEYTASTHYCSYGMIISAVAAVIGVVVAVVVVVVIV